MEKKKTSDEESKVEEAKAPAGGVNIFEGFKPVKFGEKPTSIKKTSPASDQPAPEAAKTSGFKFPTTENTTTATGFKAFGANATPAQEEKKNETTSGQTMQFNFNANANSSTNST